MFHLSSPGVFVFKDSDSWDSFCNEYWTGDYPGNNIPRPEVDFEVDMVVGIFWGQTGGCYHWVNCVRAVFIRRDVIEVQIGRPDLGSCDRIIWPKQIIKMDRHDFPVEFYGDVPQ